MFDDDCCTFLPNVNPYGIAEIPVGNDVRLNYEYDAFWHPVGMHHCIIYFNSNTIGQWSECITSGKMPTPTMRSSMLSVTMW